ncbi:Vacuolar protein sorting-associated protein 13A [Trichinella pseudospiralis]|uniref:Vacuolar protein sorting-associated protein 13A n=1 Tax=Trichinella pseudospiralis TaxID=6337 RepID=A0A0V1J3V3_TRIPS|nr:Vacuolar protein sorting-associated protein 13A [Trichinella pseudospiralis]
MLNSFFATMLFKPIGKFFYFDERQVKSVDLINGILCLENVPIRETALQRLRLPIAASSGLARKLVLSIPKVICGRELSEVEIEELYLLLVPCNEKKIDDLDGEIDEETTQRKFELTERMQRRLLANMEPNLQLPEDNIAYDSVELRIVAKYLTLWYKNESSAAGKEQSFSLLLQIDRLLFVQTEHVLGFGSETVQCEFSGIRLFYTDDDDDVENLNNSDENDESCATDVPTNDCIFEACKICIRIEKNSLQLSNWRLPSRLFSVLISGLNFYINPICLRKIQNLLENWLLYYRKSQYEKWRPLNDVKSSPRQWWQFAALCLVKNNPNLNKAKSLKCVLSRIRVLLQYVRSYGQKLVGRASENDICSLSRLEIDLPTADVLLFRHVALNFIIRNILREKKGNAVNVVELENTSTGEYGKEHCIPAVLTGKILTVVELKLKNVFLIASQNEEDANKSDCSMFVCLFVCCSSQTEIVVLFQVERATICTVLDCCVRLEISTTSGNGGSHTVRLRVAGDRAVRLKISSVQLGRLREYSSVVLLFLRPFLESAGVTLEPHPTTGVGFETWLQVQLSSLTLVLHDGNGKREFRNLFHVEARHLSLVLAKSTTAIGTFRIALPYLKCWNAMDGTVLLFLRQMKSPDLKANEFFRRTHALMSSMKEKIDEHHTSRLNGYLPIFCFDKQKFTFDDDHLLKLSVVLLHRCCKGEIGNFPFAAPLPAIRWIVLIQSINDLAALCNAGLSILLTTRH